MTSAFLLVASGSAVAQQPAGSPPSPPATNAPPSSAPNAQVGFERKPQLSLQDEMTQADVILGRIEQTAGIVRHQLEAARGARDVVKTLCLNDKLSQIDVASRSAKDRQSALASAVERKDTELSNHEFTILTVLRQRAEQLSAEANQCIGEELAFIGQTQVSTYIDPNLPVDETGSTGPSELGGVGTPPSCVTCTSGP